MIKTILFDLGEVLINNSFDAVLAEVAKNLGIDFDKLEELRDKHNDALGTGKMSMKIFNEMLKNNFELKLSQQEIFSIWENSYKKITTINEELYDFAKILKKKYKIGLISNIYDLMAKIEKERGVFKIFDPCILSCEIGLRKPNRDIFEFALKELKLQGEECVFIDNKDINLKEAKNLNFQTILFQNNEQTIKALKDLGIKI